LLFAGCEEAKQTRALSATESPDQRTVSQLDFLNRLSKTLSGLAAEMNTIKTVEDLENHKDGLLTTLGNIETMIEEFHPDSASENYNATDISQTKSKFKTALSAIDVAMKSMPIEVLQTDFVRQELSREFTKLGNSLKTLGREAAEDNN
jgi:hypothetical protein